MYIKLSGIFKFGLFNIDVFNNIVILYYLFEVFFGCYLKWNLILLINILMRGWLIKIGVLGFFRNYNGCCVW